MQRVIIIPVDGYVSIDGRDFSDLDLSTVDPQIHAVQWYGASGEMELVPDVNGRSANIAITSMAFVQPALDAWQAAVDEQDNPPPLSVADAAAERIVTLSSESETAMSVITSGYPEGEIKSWDKQEAEAHAYTADPASPTPLLSALAVARGVTVDYQAGRIIAKADAFATTAGAIIGKRQALEDQVEAIVAANALPQTDTGYIDDDAARLAIEAITW